MSSDSFEWDGRAVRPHHVSASTNDQDGTSTLRVERDLTSLAFDAADLARTVDEPTFVVIDGLDIQDGAFEVQVRSRLLSPTPFEASQGFIGVAFRIAPDDSAFESIYLRPNAGRSPDQFIRNHTVQYFAYPDHKFDRLREDGPGRYESWADVGLDEWITMRVEFNAREARLYLNDGHRPAFIVNQLLGSTESGTIGLWVDIGTEGFFRNLRILQQTRPARTGGTGV